MRNGTIEIAKANGMDQVISFHLTRKKVAYVGERLREIPERA